MVLENIEWANKCKRQVEWFIDALLGPYVFMLMFGVEKGRFNLVTNC